MGNDFTENWRPVYGYEDSHEVSNLGRVRNKSGKILKDRIKSKMGYRCVVLRGRQRGIASLVLEAFVCPRPKQQVVRHLNGNPQDDRLCNLAWGTQSENIFDQIDHGTNRFNDVVVKITNLSTGEVFVGRQRPLSRQLNLNHGRIWRCCNKGGTTKGFKCEYVVTEEE